MKRSVLSRSSLLSSLIALAALPIGCAGDEESAPLPPDSSAPIASVALDNGNQIEFYEPSPGVLLVSELGTAGVAPLATSQRNPVELYRELAPGAPVPAALLAAQERSERLPPGAAPKLTAGAAEPSMVAPPPAASFIDNLGCDDAWFNTNFCPNGTDWQLCLLNQWNGAYAYRSSVDWVRHAVCADVGDVTLRVAMGDGAGGSWSVPQGSYRTFTWRDTCVFGCNEYSRGEVLNASNDRFHYSMRVNF